MYNVLAAHPHRQGLTYLEHWLFAMRIAGRLLATVVAFAVHAVLPFIHIEPRLDLESTTAFLLERNRWIESRKRVTQAGARPYPSAVGHVQTV